MGVLQRNSSAPCHKQSLSHAATETPKTLKELEALRISRWTQALERARLERWARALHDAPDGMTEYEHRQIAHYLHRLADTPAAIEAMLADPKGPGRPPAKASRDWKMSLDYEVTKERLQIAKLGKADVAKAEVGKAWGVGRTVLMDAHNASSEHPLWSQWGDACAKKIRSQP